MDKSNSERTRIDNLKDFEQMKLTLILLSSVMLSFSCYYVYINIINITIHTWYTQLALHSVSFAKIFTSLTGYIAAYFLHKYLFIIIYISSIVTVVISNIFYFSAFYEGKQSIVIMSLLSIATIQWSLITINSCKLSVINLKYIEKHSTLNFELINQIINHLPQLEHFIAYLSISGVIRSKLLFSGDHIIINRLIDKLDIQFTLNTFKSKSSLRIIIKND